MKACKTGCAYIDDYIASVRRGPSSKWMLLAADWVQSRLETPGVLLHADKTEKARELMERYFAVTLFPWELFVLALIHCEYGDGTLVFTEYLILMGRGNGKNGFISPVAWYLTTHYHGITGYNVDIVANSEDQAKTSFDDIYTVLERTWAKSKRFFYKSKVLIENLKTRSYIKFNTANAKTKDGKRSGCVIFDEEHEYETDENIRVYISGFGKVPHCRIFKITTQGYVRGGVLDDDLAIAQSVLAGEIPSSRLCPLLYMMDSDEECQNPDFWVKANPSLPYLPTLRGQIEEDFQKISYSPSVALDFYTKRMNRPRSNMEIAVTEWENIKATNIPIDYAAIEGSVASVGIDFASLRDWAAVNVHLRLSDDKRVDFGHYWLCAGNPDLPRIRAPWREWAENGLLTVVDDAEISPYLLTDYIKSVRAHFSVPTVAIDGFRYALMSKALGEIGYDWKQYKNIKLVRPSDIMKIQPVIDSCFNNHLFVWGDNAPLRWATNNCKLIRVGKKTGEDIGNFVYGKIEAKSRKTDPFMALVAAMSIEQTATSIPEDFPELEIIT